MAKSGRINLSVTSPYNNIKGWVEWWESDINIANNTSRVHAKLVYQNTGSVSTYSDSSSFYLIINGNRTNKTNGATLSPGSTVMVLEDYWTIKHNDDGTKSISISAGGGLTGTSGLKNSSGSATVTLETIPRASSVSASAMTMGSAATLKVTRKSIRFTHTITYKFCNVTGTIATKSTSTSIAWTPPVSLAEQIPNNATAPCVFTITTYSGSTTVGTKTTSVPLSVPTSMVPTITSFAVVPVNSTEWIASKNIYAQGYTRARAKTAAAGVSGSTIKSIIVNAGKKKYSGGDVTTDGLPAGSVAIKVTVTDSRGKTATQVKTVTVYPYFVPNIDKLEYARGQYADGVWTPSETGDDVLFTFNAAIGLTDQGNTADVTITADGIYVNNPDEASGAKSVYVTAFGTDDTKVVTVSISDKLGNSSQKQITIATVAVPLNINTLLPGIAIGKVAELEKTVDIDWDVLHRKGSISPSATSRIILVDMKTFPDLGVSADAVVYYEAWLKWVCTEYPGLINTTFVGLTRPSTIRFVICTVYNTSAVNGNGLPQYSGGMAINGVRASKVNFFGTYGYEYECTT